MKNTFSPIELQVILNLLNTGSVEYIEADMLREKIERLKANPPSLRETAKQYVADLINGVITDPNSQRLDAARLVIEGYWGSEDEDDSCHSITCPHVNPALWTGDNIPTSARIKDLDCSTPTEKTQKQKDHEFTHELPIRGDRPTGQFGDFLPDGAYPIPNAAADIGSRESGKYPVAGGPAQKYSVGVDFDTPHVFSDVVDPLEMKVLVETKPEDIHFGGTYSKPSRHVLPEPLKPEDYEEKSSPIDFAKIAAEGGPAAPGDWKNAPTLESGTGGPVLEPKLPETIEEAVAVFNDTSYYDIKGWYLRDEWVYAPTMHLPAKQVIQIARTIVATKPQPMTLEHALAVFNSFGHRKRNDWQIGKDDWMKVCCLHAHVDVPSWGYTEFEAIAIAEKLEREK